MNVKNWKFNQNTKKGGILLAASLLAVQRMTGSSVIMSPPPVPTTPPVVQEDMVNNEMNVFIPSGVVNPDSAGLFQYGPATLHPHVSYSFLYGSGIESSVNNQQNTIVQQLSPGLTVDLGRHWTVDYTPTLHFYSNDKFHDGVDHSASLNGATHYGDWSFELSQGFTSTSDPITETAAQTDQQAYTTALTAGYAFNDKWSASFAVDQDFSFVTGSQNSYNWSTVEGVSYQFFPRLNAGISIGSGYTKVEDNSGGGSSNPDSINEQLQFNVNWRATDKISFQVSAGAEDQQFLAAGSDEPLNPIFSASIQYQPFKVTQISLTASRTVSASTQTDFFTSAQSSENTVIGLNLNQRILVKYNLTLGVSYTKTDYISTLSLGSASIGTQRSDNDYTFNASFGRNFLTHGNWAITYQYSDNSSSVAGFSQRSNQIGLQVGFNY
jgi:Putative beta-barrel porin 2